MNTETAQVDDLQLVAYRSAVNCADIFVRFALREWSLAGLQDEALNVSNQLVAAAVDNADPKNPGLLTVRLRLQGAHLVLEVEGSDLPVQAPTIGNLRTGVEPMRSGRRVWCEMPLPGGLAANSVQLPRRERKPPPPSTQNVPPEATEVDPEVIERLLSGLKNQ